MKKCVLFFCCLFLSACCTSSFTNKSLDTGVAKAPSQASFDIRQDRGSDDVLVLLALSGGGSRAAYFSSSVMLKLQKIFDDIDILKEIDVISSVSGGGLPAAYYCISKDPDGTTFSFDGPVDCEAIKNTVNSGNLICDAKKRLIGVKKKMTTAEKEALKKILPGESKKIDRLFAISQKSVVSNRNWDEATVKGLMKNNYQSRWVGNFFWPLNIIRYWSTAHDRSDIMAQTLEDNFFDVYPTGGELLFGDLNPERPYLIINATDGSEDAGNEEHFGKVFTFTKEDFEKYIYSDISSYSVARAVMASAAFPGAFNYMTLRDFRKTAGKEKKRYLHVFDGGNADNLGLTSLKKIILQDKTGARKYKHYVVILIDAFVKPQGIDRNDCDPRSLFSYVVDMNFMHSFDSLLKANRRNIIDEFKTKILTGEGNSVHTVRNMTFLHVTFEETEGNNAMKMLEVECPECNDPEKPQEPVSLQKALNKIPTNFKLSAKNAKIIDKAVDILVTKDNACLKKIRQLLMGKPFDAPGPGHDPCE